MTNRPRRSSVHLFLIGFALPFSIIYTIYLIILKNHEFEIFHRSSTSYLYRQNFLDRSLSTPVENPQLVVVGDSSAKSSFIPQRVLEVSSVNLGLNKGNAITAYWTIDNLLQHYPAPNCVLMIYHYNWEHSYRDFFEVNVRFKAMSYSELKGVWNESAHENLFPASSYSFPNFWLHVLIYQLRLDHPEFSELQELFWNKKNVVPEAQRSVRIERSFGYQSSATKDRAFYTADYHEQFLRDFSPSLTEDHYLKKLVDLANKHQIKFFLTSLPFAQSDLLPKVRPFTEQRNAYLESLSKKWPGLTWIQLPSEESRQYMVDLSHTNHIGAQKYTDLIWSKIKSQCLH